MVIRNTQGGETIVEVLICMAALGFMLLSAFTLTNRNQATNQASQERSRATKVMESQLELLRGYTTDAILPAGSFCLKEDPATDRVDSAPSCPLEDGVFLVAITNPHPPGSLICDPAQPLIVKVTWESLVKGTDEELTTPYLACNKFIQLDGPTALARLA